MVVVIIIIKYLYFHTLYLNHNTKQFLTCNDLLPILSNHTGGTGLIITGGITPNRRGRLSPFAGKLTNRLEMMRHRILTDAVHEHGGHIAMQILHAGRYGYHPFSVAPSSIQGGK